MNWQRLHRLYHANSQRFHRRRRRMQDLGRSFKWESAPAGTTTTRLWPPINLGSLLELAHWAQTARGSELAFQRLWYTHIPLSQDPGFNYASIHAATPGASQ